MDSMITCPSCGAMLPAGTKHCTECGAKLDAQPGGAAAAAAFGTAQDTAAKAEEAISEAEAVEFTKIFLNTEFEGGRHERRIAQIAAIERGEL